MQNQQRSFALNCCVHFTIVVLTQHLNILQQTVYDGALFYSQVSDITLFSSPQPVFVIDFAVVSFGGGRRYIGKSFCENHLTRG